MLSIDTRSRNLKSSLKSLEDSFEKFGNFFEKCATSNFENKYILNNQTGNPKHKITLKKIIFLEFLQYFIEKLETFLGFPMS